MRGTIKTWREAALSQDLGLLHVSASSHAAADMNKVEAIELLVGNSPELRNTWLMQGSLRMLLRLSRNVFSNCVNTIQRPMR